MSPTQKDHKLCGSASEVNRLNRPQTGPLRKDLGALMLRLRATGKPLRETRFAPVSSPHAAVSDFPLQISGSAHKQGFSVAPSEPIEDLFELVSTWETATQRMVSTWLL